MKRRCGGGAEPVAVVGVACIFPGAVSVAEYWDNICAARDLITEVPEHYWLIEDYYDPDPAKPGKVYAKRGGFLPRVTFDPEYFRMPPTSLSSVDTVQLLTLIAAERLLRGLNSFQNGLVDKGKTAVILGGAAATEMMGQLIGTIQIPIWRNAMRQSGLPETWVDKVLDNAAGSFNTWTENSFPGLLANITAGRVANQYDLKGKNCVVDAACASSLAAVSDAVAELRMGKADLVITGGVDAHNDSFMYMCFSKTPAMSPTGDCRPFSDQADGMLLGEGVGLLALRRLSDAVRDNDPVYAVIRGVGASADGFGKSIYAPQVDGQVLALERAYEDAGFSPAGVGLVEAHGTATKANDSVEFSGLCQVFAPEVKGLGQCCALGSVKSQIGHAKSAAGAASLIKTVLALHHRVLPPTIKVDRPNPLLGIDQSPFYLNTETRPWISSSPRRAGVNAFGFGGTNYHVVLEQAPFNAHGLPRKKRYSGPDLFLLSADSPDEMVRELQGLTSRITNVASMAVCAWETREGFDSLKPCRMSVVGRDGSRVVSLMGRAMDRILENGEDGFSLAGVLHYTAGPAFAGKLAFLFPGQGSQYPGMAKELVLTFDRAMDTWEAIARMPGMSTLHQQVYPLPVFEEKDRENQAEALGQTENAQPGIGATSLVTLALLTQAGIRAEMTGGHSYGEIPALFAAGMIPDMEQVMAMSGYRGRLMGAAAEGRVPGGMTAVMASTRECRQIMDLYQGQIKDGSAHDLSIANENSPGQVVVSGSIEHLGGLESLLKQAGIRFKRLKVSHAFHSGVFGPARDLFFEKIRPMVFLPPRVPAYANTTAEPYPDVPETVPRMLADQLLNPVRFREQIENMYRDGARIFVEVGPGKALTGLVQACLPLKDILAVSSDAGDRDSLTGFLNLLGVLSVHGRTVDYSTLFAEFEPGNATGELPGRVSALAVSIDGSNYKKPYPPKGGAGALALPVTDTDGLQGTDSRLYDAQAFEKKIQESGPDGLPELYRELVKTQEAFENQAARMRQQFSLAGQAIVRRMHDGHLSPADDRPRVEDRGGATENLPGPSQDEDVYIDALFEIITEKTGYPREILDLDTDLEAGFGIDSIKRVEILGCFEERFPKLDLGEQQSLYGLRTLQEVFDHIRKNVKVIPSALPLPAVSNPVEKAEDPGETAHPSDRLEICCRSFVTVPKPLTQKDRSLADPSVFQVLCQDRARADALVRALDRNGGAGQAVSGTENLGTEGGSRFIFWVARQNEGTWQEKAAVSRETFLWFKAIAPMMRKTGGEVVLVQETGGAFHLSGPAGEPWQAGLPALAKTAAMEWPKARVRVVDLDWEPGCSDACAGILAEELLFGRADTEVGLGRNGTRVVLAPREVESPDSFVPLPEGAVVLASGGTRGVTAACLAALARTGRLKIAVLGTTAPGSLGWDEVSRTCQDLEACGAEVMALTADVREPDQVDRAVEKVRREFGPISVLIHGSGVLLDKHIDEKEAGEFDRVFETKVHGLIHLLNATSHDPLTHICCFTSIAAKSGNIRQADYCMANEVVNKICMDQALKRGPACRVRALNWGPWELGMLKERHWIFLKAIGMELIRSGVGADQFVRHLLGQDPWDGVEVVVTAERKQGGRLFESGFSFSIGESPWVLDHCPDFITPVLPMMVELDLVAAATQAFAKDNADWQGSAPAFYAERFESRHWARFTDQALSGRVTGAALDDSRIQIEVHAESGPLESILVAEAIVSTVALESRQADPVEDLIKGKPVDAGRLYAQGSLFHGPGFQRMTGLILGENGATCQVNCAPGKVPEGCLHPSVLDACLHCIPGTCMDLWYPDIGRNSMAFPLRLESFCLYRRLPLMGQVRVEARKLRVDNRYFPVIRFWVFDADGLCAQFTLTLTLQPKGPLAGLDDAGRKRFLTGSGPVSGLGLLTGQSHQRQLEIKKIRDTGLFANTLTRVCGVPEGLDTPYGLLAEKLHLGDVLNLHPSRVVWDRATQRCRNLPFNALSLEVQETAQTVTTRLSGPGPLMTESGEAFWRDSTVLGTGNSLLVDIAVAFLTQFVRRVVVEDPEFFKDRNKTPVIFLSNHQVGIETLMLSLLQYPITGMPFFGIANKAQGQGIIGGLKMLSDIYLGSELPFHLMVFDQENRASLFALLNEFKKAAKPKGGCLYVATEGRRAFFAGHRVTKLSAVFTDLAIDNGWPIVPVRFAGGLPNQTTDNPRPEVYLDFPFGYGSQDYYLGAPVFPADLVRLSNHERTQLVVDRINGLGPELSCETPLGPDPGFDRMMQDWDPDLPDIGRVVAAGLSRLAHPCDETRLFLERLRTGKRSDLDQNSMVNIFLSFLLPGQK